MFNLQCEKLKRGDLCLTQALLSLCQPFLTSWNSIKQKGLHNQSLLDDLLGLRKLTTELMHSSESSKNTVKYNVKRLRGSNNTKTT